jgi:hypothetical protein
MLWSAYMIFDKFFGMGEAITAPRAIAVTLILISGFQFLLFAMLFDMQESK